MVLAISLTCADVRADDRREGANLPALFDRPMTFAIVRSGAGYCEPVCPEWIYGEGRISPGTPAAFKKIVKKAGDRRLPLIITSPGGDVDAAMALGRLIRKEGLAVEVGYTRFVTCRPTDDDCKPDGARDGEYYGSVAVAGSFCWSACPLALAGGERRLSSRWSYTGVHQVTTTYRRQKIYYKERYEIVDGKRKVVSREEIRRKDIGPKSSTKMPKATRKALSNYLGDMGVDLVLLDLMQSATPDKIRTLEPVEMLKIGLITELSSTDMLTAPQSCLTPDRPDNCVLLPSTAPASTLSTLEPEVEPI
ncbi:hypothetical protein [Rhizobium sp. TRM95796]|uniref:COG3904 family protein n=1 Tax=Rhizobium sp. TRM95796 TaxID=2979862 RepID=UPI0021E7E069|nr:hypothetical protein [Rhizobium sp. TRM95796]MCV3764882.1 hypothetical protein [Rhizobium sp. TRM95796]